MARVTLADYPQLRLLAWNRRGGDGTLDERDAFGLYEREWHHIDRATLTNKERELIRRLAARFGNGVLHV